MTATVDNSGYTPYIYSYFPNDEKRLFLVNGDNAYTRTCSADVLKAGESGYMAVPTQDAASGWQKGFVIPVNGVLLRMQPVTGHSNGDFFMAETETTEELWGAVDKTAAATSTPSLPVSDVSYPAVTTFITSLNSLTGFTFSLPTTVQWEYAKKGGKYSKNYTYAGSNTVGDVCWYSGNASAKQPVGTKMPNELGLYDLSGNVSEFAWISSGTSAYTYPNIMGGSYTTTVGSLNSYTTLSTSYYSSTSCKASYVGFRLVLDFP
jgi:formylglycine-generating enzyme required for sulfatase activity